MRDSQGLWNKGRRKRWTSILRGLVALVIITSMTMGAGYPDVEQRADIHNDGGTVNLVGDKIVTLAAAKTSSRKHVRAKEKIVYLTFDDGPSKHTAEVLDILKREGVPATFFVLGEQVKQYPKLVKRIAAEGHALGNHSYDHNYKQLYGDFRTFWKQIRDTGQAIKDVVGYEPRLVRAPGGTVLNFDKQYFQLLDQAGYIVHDWHVDSGDSKRRNVPASEIIRSIKTGAQLEHTVVLMHDNAGHGETVKALGDIIQFYRDKGYTFRAMTPELKPVQFKLSSRVRWERSQVTQAWIDQHVSSVDVSKEPQSPKQETANPMRFQAVTEKGRLILQPEQYWSDDSYTYVPARLLAKHIGGEIVLDKDNRHMRLIHKKGSIIVDRWKGKVNWEKLDGLREQFTWKGIERDGTLWLPLRQVLDTAGIRLLEYELMPADTKKIAA